MARTKQKGSPGRKKGRVIKNSVALKPLGVKNTIKYEIGAQSALSAIENNVCKEQHLIDLRVLASLSYELTDEEHIQQHAHSVNRMCDQIENAGYKTSLIIYVPMSISVNILLCNLLNRDNMQIYQCAKKAIKSLTSAS